MTDYTTADRITAKLAAKGPKLAGSFHGDTYELVRDVRTSDGRGGTTTVPGVVEAGRCALIPSRAQGSEGSSAAGVVESIYRQAAELPIATIAKPDDVLSINGVRYQIIAVMKPGNHDLFPVADLERVT